MKKYRPLLVLLILIGIVFFVTSETALSIFLGRRTTTLKDYVKDNGKNFRIIKPPTKEQAEAINKSKQNIKR